MMEPGIALKPPTPADSEAAEVFLSFSSVDRATALRVEEMIEGLGLRCWSYASDQEAGGYADHMAKAIEGCRIVVLILTPASNASQAVQREIGLAVERGRLILPLCEDSTFELAPSLEYWIRTMYWSASLEELERLLRKELPAPPASPSDGIAAPATTPAAATTETTGWRWWNTLLIGMALLGFGVV